MGSDPRFEETAHELGVWIADAGHALVYGGSAIGLMGVISRAVLDRGGAAYGVEPQFFLDAGVEQHDLTELIAVETMGERKAKMIDLGDAFVALPGGFGTLEEISEIMSRIRLGLGPAECYLLNVGGYYDGLQAFLQAMPEAGFVDESDLACVHFPSSVADLAQLIEAAEHAPTRRAPTAAELVRLHDRRND